MEFHHSNWLYGFRIFLELFNYFLQILFLELDLQIIRFRVYKLEVKSVLAIYYYELVIYKQLGIGLGNLIYLAYEYIELLDFSWLYFWLIAFLFYCDFLFIELS
jgi:hypothetical protein